MKAVSAVLIGLFVIAGCEQDGPLERAGEEIDEAAEDIQVDGQELGNRVDDAIDDLRQ